MASGLNINEFFSAHELNRLEVGFSMTRQTFTAIRNSSAKLIKDSLFGEGDTPEAAIADLIAKVNGSARQTPVPVVIEEVPDDLEDLLG